MGSLKGPVGGSKMSISRIILLTSEADAPILVDVLHRHNSAIDVIPVATLEALHGAFAHLPPITRLLSFCSPVIVPAALLATLPSPAYNFHPGPPERPGRYPSVFALYDNDARFGVTVHEMLPRVDSGPIVTAEWFDIPTGADLGELESLSRAYLLAVYQRMAPYMVNVTRPLPQLMYRWSGRKTSKAQCEDLCRLTPEMDETEIARRDRACGIFLRRS